MCRFRQNIEAFLNMQLAVDGKNAFLSTIKDSKAMADNIVKEE